MDLVDDPDERDGSVADQAVADQALTGPAARLGNEATETLGGLAT